MRGGRSKLKHGIAEARRGWAKKRGRRKYAPSYRFNEDS